MKKFKEFVKKIGNKKRCLLSLLLAGLLIFSIVSGLNGSKSAVTEVNAQSVPTTQNLDLNGVRYTYQTSLNELKNKYNFFTNIYYENLFTIVQNTESEVFFELYGQKIDISLDEEQINNTKIKINDAFKFYDANNKLIKTSISEDVILSQPLTNSLVYSYNNEFELKNFNSFSIDFVKLFSIDNIDNEYITIGNNAYGEQGMSLVFVYLNNEYDSNIDDKEYLKANSKFYSYTFSKIPTEYIFIPPRYENFHLVQFYAAFIDEEKIEHNIVLNVPNVFDEYTDNNYTNKACVINNLKFYDYNTIGYNFDYSYQYSFTEAIYQGNLLLSSTKFDNELLEYVNGVSIPARVVYQNIGQVLHFGGNFNNSNDVSYIQYSGTYTTNSMSITKENEPINNPKSILYTCLSSSSLTPQKVLYKNQNQLLYIKDISDLKIKDSGGYTGLGLSAQVEDILYNVNYIGNIEEKEFNDKVQDDFTDLLKTTGLGAVIGILIGFLVGNPIGGLVVGAIIGFAVAIIPLIIDGLQSIFGYNFLRGLYNFFNAITEFFVNLVDTIINFLLSIITNPFVLVLIVIVAILYIFVIRPKIK